MTSRYCSVRLALLACLALSCLGGWAGAADDREPYRIRLVLAVARHRLLTKTFQEQVARELKDGLQAALGNLAKVEVATDHPKLEEVRKQGLGRWLDRWSERSQYQTHFVQIDYERTSYTIQTRQHDGLTGLASPVVRRDRTRDPAYVARTAVLLIERNLGLLGTVASEADGRNLIQVSLKGGKLGVDLGRWVRKGEVFGLVSATGVLPGQANRWSVLQVEEPAVDGVCFCRLFTRARGSFPITGMRCVLLGTHKGPLRLRLVQQLKDGETKPGLPAPVTVQIRHNGFEGEDATRLELTTDGSRDVDTSSAVYRNRGIFDRLALVTVLLPGERFVRMPVPLIDDGLTVLPVPESNAQDHPALFRLESLRRNVMESCLVQRELFERINKLTENPDKRAEALAAVRKTLTRSQEDYRKLTNEVEEVTKALTLLKDKDKPSNTGAALKAIDTRLREINSGEKELLRHLIALEKIEKEENDPKRKEWLIKQERARALVKEAELGKAIEIYEKAPAEFMTPELKKHIDDLKRRWMTHGDKHAAARRFIYTVWPTLTTTGMEARIKEARDAVVACKAAKDVVGLSKMAKATDLHVQRLEKELSSLKPDVNGEDKKLAKVVLDLIKELRKLDADMNDFLEPSK